MHKTKKVIASIITQGNKILMAQRAKKDSLYGLWEFPGGKLEDGETEQECLQRELNEEFGIDAFISDYLCSSFFVHNNHEYEMKMYHVPSFKGSFDLKEHSDFKWLTTDELNNYPVPEPDKPVILFLQNWLK